MLVLRGELDLSTVPVVDGELLEPRRPPSDRLDLRELEFIDSTGLHMLIQADKRARASGGRVMIVQGTPQVRRVLELTRIAEHLEAVRRATALAGLSTRLLPPGVLGVVVSASVRQSNEGDAVISEEVRAGGRSWCSDQLP